MHLVLIFYMDLEQETLPVGRLGVIRRPDGLFLATLAHVVREQEETQGGQLVLRGEANPISPVAPEGFTGFSGSPLPSEGEAIAITALPEGMRSRIDSTIKPLSIQSGGVQEGHEYKLLDVKGNVITVTGKSNNRIAVATENLVCTGVSGTPILEQVNDEYVTVGLLRSVDPMRPNSEAQGRLCAVDNGIVYPF